MTYFRTGRPRTIIGVLRFHFRVRNGIGWFPQAMATRQTLQLVTIWGSSTRRLRADAPVAWVLYGQAARSISTGRLHVLPRVDRRPINVVVFDGPSGGLCLGRPHLGRGFPLRCFQRLSRPYVATRPCPWQDNRCTRGTSTPVLSY